MSSRLVIDIATCLRQQQQRLATAESCTGGWIAKQLTDVPGSSDWFDRGFVTYSNEAKQDMLGVPQPLIEQQGAVSEAVVSAMAAGAIERSRAQWSVAVSGIAGPGGGSDEKPVGLVWLAWGMPDGIVHTECCHFDGERDEVRQSAVETALQGLKYRILRSLET